MDGGATGEKVNFSLGCAKVELESAMNREEPYELSAGESRYAPVSSECLYSLLATFGIVLHP